MTYLKVTDGVLKVKSNLVSRPDARVEFEEKADQLRVYSGSKYRLVSEAPAGTVCAVLGPTKTYPGQGLGVQPDARQPMLEPVLNYRVELPPTVPFWPCAPWRTRIHSCMWCGTPLWARSTCS